MTLFIQRNDNDHVPCLLDLPTKFLPLLSLSVLLSLTHRHMHMHCFFVGEYLFFYLGCIESAKPKAKHFILEIKYFIKKAKPKAKDKQAKHKKKWKQK